MRELRKQRPDLGMNPCDCGCGGHLSNADHSRYRWLASLSADVPPHEGRINLATSGIVHYRDRPEPATQQRCTACGTVFELPTFIAEFQERWAKSKPRCSECVRVANAGQQP